MKQLVFVRYRGGWVSVYGFFSNRLNFLCRFDNMSIDEAFVEFFEGENE